MVTSLMVTIAPMKTNIPVYEEGTDSEGFPNYVARPGIAAMMASLTEPSEEARQEYLEKILDEHDCGLGPDSGCPCTALRWAYNRSEAIEEAEGQSHAEREAEGAEKAHQEYLNSKME